MEKKSQLLHPFIKNQKKPFFSVAASPPSERGLLCVCLFQQFEGQMGNNRERLKGKKYLFLLEQLLLNIKA